MSKKEYILVASTSQYSKYPAWSLYKAFSAASMKLSVYKQYHREYSSQNAKIIWFNSRNYEVVALDCKCSDPLQLSNSGTCSDQQHNG